jgi:hypothetical protein
VVDRLATVADLDLQIAGASPRVVAVAGDWEGGPATDRDCFRWSDVEAGANAFGADDRHGAAV